MICDVDVTPVRFARFDAPIVLAHGLFGFTRIGIGRLTLTSYFRGIPQAIEEAGNRVLVTRVPPIAGIERRASRLGEQIEHAFGDEPVHLIGHSMGGLDARRLLANAAWQRRILSLTTIGTPHLGSSLADFAKLRVGRVYRLMASLGIDPQGCLDVTRRAARRFHRTHPPPAGYSLFLRGGRPDPRNRLLAAATSTRCSPRWKGPTTAWSRSNRPTPSALLCLSGRSIIAAAELAACR